MKLKIGNKKPTGKMIAAAIILLLGIILAIGYPTGGVKAHKNYTNKNTVKKAVVSQPAVKQPGRTNKVIKKKVTKKRVVQPVSPSLNNNSDDEGC